MEISEELISQVTFMCGIVYSSNSIPKRGVFLGLPVYCILDGKFYSANSTSINAINMNSPALEKLYGVIFEHYDAQNLTHIGSNGEVQHKINKKIDTALNGKQDTIPNFSLISTQTANGVTVNVYSDGFNVYVVFNGTATVGAGSSASPSATTILTLSNTAYAPIVNTQVPVRESAGGHRMKLNSSGVMQYLNDTSGTSFSIHGAFYYPLKSRLP